MDLYLLRSKLRVSYSNFYDFCQSSVQDGTYSLDDVNLMLEGYRSCLTDISSASFVDFTPKLH